MEEKHICKAKSSFLNPLDFSEGINNKWMKSSCFKVN